MTAAGTSRNGETRGAPSALIPGERRGLRPAGDEPAAHAAALAQRGQREADDGAADQAEEDGELELGPAVAVGRARPADDPRRRIRRLDRLGRLVLLAER